jgi:DNA-binding NarL/FixJ family response regulator
VDLGAAILVVDDDPGIRALVGGLLGRVGYQVREASDGAAAITAARRERPALVVLDVELPVVSGYEVYRELRDRYGDGLPVLFLSGARTEPYDRAAGLMLGADDYVVKPFDPGELLARIRRLVTHSVPTASDSGSTLTAREREVLALLAEGLEQTDIAKKLFISPKTVATHIQRILAKLGVHSRAQAVAMAHRDHLVVASNGNGRS